MAVSSSTAEGPSSISSGGCKGKGGSQLPERDPDPSLPCLPLLFNFPCRARFFSTAKLDNNNAQASSSSSSASSPAAAPSSSSSSSSSCSSPSSSSWTTTTTTNNTDTTTRRISTAAGLDLTAAAAAAAAAAPASSQAGGGEYRGRRGGWLVPTASHAAPGHQRPIALAALAHVPQEGPPPPTNYSRPRPPPPPSTPPGAHPRSPPRHQTRPAWQPSHARFPSQGSYLQELQQQSPFRVRADSAGTHHSRHHRSLSASRLWNPTNSTRSFLLQATTPPPPPPPPRPPTPDLPPPIPIPRLTLDDVSSVNLAGAVAQAGDVSLLTPSEQRGRASPQIDQAGRDSVSLPRSVRHSYDEIRSRSTPTPTPSPSTETEAGPSTARPQPERKKPGPGREQAPTAPTARGEQAGPDATGTGSSAAKGTPRYYYAGKGKAKSKGKGKTAMAVTDDAERQAGASLDRDLEQGPEPHRRDSMGSLDDGIGSAISSSNSSIMGDPDGQADDDEWGPQHPCFPHLNPHVPIDSPEYVNTRIIRIKRDWLLEGDLAPTFSNMYPEILDPAGLSEVEFRRVIEKLNTELTAIFNPYSLRNILDGVMGLLTGWIWDDVGLTNAKARLARLERWIERWNKEMEKTAGGDDNVTPPRIVPLRQTAYMTLDIQIFDPEIQTAQSTSRGDSRGADSDMPVEPAPALTAN